MAIGLSSNDCSAQAPISFGRDIQPILSENCFYCHGQDEQHREADLRLDVRAVAIETKALVPGASQESQLVRRILSDDPELQMPPPSSNRRLSESQKRLLVNWIEQGADYEEHWAFLPPVRPIPPERIGDSMDQHPIDVCVRDGLRKLDLRPGPEASPEKLLRRVSLDLTGLPPTMEELDEFLTNPDEDAYERHVQRLLDSPRFGERMVWDWLEAARYADTNGYQGDPTRAMWHWRDWAIRAFNNNMPFDQFTLEQLAGDLLDPSTQDQRIATGFHRNHMINGEGGRIAEESRVEYVQDRVETTGTVWMGLTLTCCRCHDHKYDPFTQKQYYQLASYFNSIDESGGNDAGGLAHPIMRIMTSQQDLQLQELLAAEQLAKKSLDELAEERELATEKWNQAKSSRESFEKSLPQTMVMRDRSTPRETHILVKGAYNALGDRVEHGLIDRLLVLEGPPRRNRLDLARWIIHPKHPLTSRVIVNRLWQQFFGVGLVKSTEDFGIQGDRPSHPELLDWLAVKFIESGWNVKEMVRLIVTSRTYRQSSHATSEAFERDPGNRWLARGPRYRLPSWMIRDQALATSGLLVEKVGGPPVKGYQPEGIWEEATFGQIRYEQDHGEALYRRSLYIFWRRIVAPTMFFDVANRQNCSVKPSQTNTPLHALVTLNDVTYQEASRQLASRVLRFFDHQGHDLEREPEPALSRLFRLATCRQVQADELNRLKTRLESLKLYYRRNSDEASEVVSVGESPVDTSWPKEDLAAWSILASIVLNLDEAITKE